MINVYKYYDFKKNNDNKQLIEELNDFAYSIVENLNKEWNLLLSNRIQLKDNFNENKEFHQNGKYFHYKTLGNSIILYLYTNYELSDFQNLEESKKTKMKDDAFYFISSLCGYILTYYKKWWVRDDYQFLLYVEKQEGYLLSSNFINSAILMKNYCNENEIEYSHYKFFSPYNRVYDAMREIDSGRIKFDSNSHFLEMLIANNFEEAVEIMNKKDNAALKTFCVKYMI